MGHALVTYAENLQDVTPYVPNHLPALVQNEMLEEPQYQRSGLYQR